MNMPTHHRAILEARDKLQSYDDRIDLLYGEMYDLLYNLNRVATHSRWIGAWMRCLDDHKINQTTAFSYTRIFDLLIGSRSSTESIRAAAIQFKEKLPRPNSSSCDDVEFAMHKIVDSVIDIGISIEYIVTLAELTKVDEGAPE